MKMHWKYWRLTDERRRTIGWMRRCGGLAQYVGLRGARWQTEPILYADRIETAWPPEGLRSLKGPS